MSDQILYTGGPNPFKGLIGGLPEPPKEKDYRRHRAPGFNDFIQADSNYNKQVESIKSNAPDIVNPELLPLQIEECDLCDGCGWYEGGPTLKTNCNNCFGTGSVIHHYFSHVKVIPGDIFDLPVGYEFKKEHQVSFDDKINWHRCTEKEFEIYKCHGEECRIVLYIVKNDVKEHDCTDYAKINCKCPDGVCEYGKKPEPEESQKELWEDVLKYCEDHYINDIRVMEHMEKHFVIQRKK